MKALFASLLLIISATTLAAEQTVVLKIQEMNCQLCAYLVNKELRALDGVVSTKSSIKDGTTVVVKNAELDNQKLIDAVAKLNYHAKVQE